MNTFIDFLEELELQPEDIELLSAEMEQLFKDAPSSELGMYDAVAKHPLGAQFIALHLSHDCDFMDCVSGKLQELEFAGIAVSVGCGTGVRELYIARNNPKMTIHALDMSAAQIDVARSLQQKSGINNVTFSTRNYVTEPIGQKCELVLALHGFPLSKKEHLQACKAVKQLIAPGGYAIIEDNGTFVGREKNLVKAGLLEASPHVYT